MTAAIRSELRKFFTTRLWWGMAIAILVAGGAFAALFSWVVNQGAAGGPGAPPIVGSDTQVANTVYTSGISVGYLLMLDQIYLSSYAFILLVVALLVFTTGKEDKAPEGGAVAIPKGGPLMAFLAVLLYAAVITLILYLNAGKGPVA